MSAIRIAAASALALALAASAPSAAQVGAPVQTVILYSYGYAPSPIVLEAGRAVTLSFVNRAGKSHDFTAREFFRSSRIIAGAAPGGKVELKAGQARSVTLIPAAGRYRVHCAKPFHKMMGMRSDIVVR